MPEQNLERAFSSKLSLVERHGKKFVRKEIDAEETENEKFFFRVLRQNGLPSLDVEDNDGLLVEYIESVTLVDRETPELYKAFGQTVRRMHDIKFEAPFRVDEHGQRQAIVWASFIKRQIEEGILRQRERQGFSQEIVDHIRESVQSRSISEYMGSASLLHCDLHQNNVLLPTEGENIYLIDKGSAIMAGDPLYDLGLIAINLPGFFGCGEKRDEMLFVAFIEGYGFDFTVDRRHFDGYVLLRALERWPNKHEPEIPAIVEGILKR